MKKAFTLIELLVYVAIMSFIIIVAGRVFSDSTSMRIRTQNMTKATEELNKVVEIIKEDMSQMGAKTYKNPNPNVINNPEGKDTIKGVFIDSDEYLLNKDVFIKKDKPNQDFSSFNLYHRGSNDVSGNTIEFKKDSIEFKKIILGNSGQKMGVRLISWALENNTLRRRCVTVKGSGTEYKPDEDEDSSGCMNGNSFTDLKNATAVAMATGVQAFGLLPSYPMAEGTNNSSSSSNNFAFTLISKGTSGANEPYDCPGDLTLDRVTLTGFATDGSRNECYVADYNTVVNLTGRNYKHCKLFKLKKGETYYVKFKTPLGTKRGDTLMTLFKPGNDHLAVGFRKLGNSNVEKIDWLKTDFMFYVPQTKEHDVNTVNHYFEFSVKDDIEACAVFTFAFSSPKAYKGSLTIHGFEIGQKEKAYHFKHTIDAGSGYNEKYATDGDPKKLENKKSVKAFELYLEINKGKNEVSTTHSTIPTPNNGIGVKEAL